MKNSTDCYCRSCLFWAIEVSDFDQKYSVAPLETRDVQLDHYEGLICSSYPVRLLKMFSRCSEELVFEVSAKGYMLLETKCYVERSPAVEMEMNAA